MTGKFFITGVGPGDPELITFKAARILDSCPVWFVPKAHMHGGSSALGILSGIVRTKDKDIFELHFPMKKIRMGEMPDPEIEKAWDTAASAIYECLAEGMDVAFPTLGDPAIYSTGFYVCDALLKKEPGLSITIVPGVSSIGATAAAVCQPLCLGDERLTVIPATFETSRIREALDDFDTIVLMKVHRVMPKLTELLRNMNLLHKAVLVECTSLNSQRIHHDIEAASRERLHYFSTIIVRK